MFFRKQGSQLPPRSIEEQVSGLNLNVHNAWNAVDAVRKTTTQHDERLAWLESEVERLTKLKKPCGSCGNREKVR